MGSNLVFRLDSENEPPHESKRYRVNQPTTSCGVERRVGPLRLALRFLALFLCSEGRFLLNEGSFSLPVSVQPKAAIVKRPMQCTRMTGLYIHNQLGIECMCAHI